VSLQELLIAALSEVFHVDQTSDDDLLLRPAGQPDGAAAVLVAAESDLAGFAERNAADGLAALGPVGGDPTGLTAAIGLLAVHVEESIGSDSLVEVTRMRVLPNGLESCNESA
jgi:hypothetical protein